VKAYEPMPAPLLALIQEQQAEAVRAAQDRAASLEAMTPFEYAKAVGVYLVRVPTWVSELCRGVPVPSIQITPNKHDGAWLVRSGNSEWYVDHDEIVAAVEASDEP